MRTIQAVELRNNLEEIYDAVVNGETIKLSYRNKSTIKLVPDESTKPKSNAKAIFKAAEKFRQSLSLEAQESLRHSTDDDIKRIRDEHTEEKYGV
jgi:antitoxin (DNA-binding transcriptional repressor) of toxin-antitoxin stability system